jgi:ligand-binding SRPBCC domain-containing protein
MPNVVFERSVVIKAPVDKVFAFCGSSHGFQRHFPYQVRWEAGPEDWREGCDLAFRFRYLGVWLPYKATITRWEPNRMFVDEMRIGPYKAFVHTHLFEPADEGTRYTDRIEFSTGFGRWVDRIVALRQIQTTFKKRHARLKALLEGDSGQASHQKTPVEE